AGKSDSATEYVRYPFHKPDAPSRAGLCGVSPRRREARSKAVAFAPARELVVQNNSVPFHYSRETVPMMVIIAGAKNQEDGLKAALHADDQCPAPYCANVPCCNSRSVC